MKFLNASINSLENFNNGKFIFSIIELFSVILRLRNKKLANVKNLSPFKKKILSLRLRLGYKVNFLKLNLEAAYKLRLFHFACIANGSLKGDSNLSKHYLSIVGNNEFLEYLNLDYELKISIKSAQKKEKIELKKVSQDRKFLGNVVLIGPGIDVSSVDMGLYDTIIFIKPPKINLDLKNKKIVIFLNNAWIKNEVDSIYSWLKKYPNTKFISPQDIKSIGIFKEQLLENLLVAPFGSSPMGLQRALFIIKSKYFFKKLTILGFNLSLSKKPYHESYPSIIKSLGIEKDVILWSNAIHDFYYNFYLTKALLKNDLKIETNLKEITNKAPQDVSDLFKKAFK